MLLRCYEDREYGSAEECVRLAIVTCHMALNAPRCDAIMRDVTQQLLGNPDISGAPRAYRRLRGSRHGEDFHNALTDTVEFDPIETLRVYLPNLS